MEGGNDNYDYRDGNEEENPFINGWVNGYKHPLFYDPSRNRTKLHKKLASEYVLKMDNDDEQQLKKGKWKLSFTPKRKYGRSNIWYIMVHLITFYLISPITSLMGMKEKRVQEAFREKVTLCKLNFFAMLAIGFVIFGLNDVCCKYTGVQLAYNKLSKSNYFSIHGRLYEAEEGMKALSGMGVRASKSDIVGKDLTLLFTISDYCDKISEDESAYSGNFKCYMPGIRFTGCHEISKVYSNMRSDGEVYISMKNIKPNTPYVIYSGVVLDMGLWEENQELVGNELYNIAKNNMGRDITRVIQSRKSFRKKAKCIVDVLRIASIDKKSSGCVFSQAIVMISFILIIGTVGTRFVIAVYFYMMHSFNYFCKKNKNLTKTSKKLRNTPRYQFDDDINNYPNRPISKNARETLLNNEERNEPITRPHFASASFAESGRLSMLVIVLIPCYSEHGDGIKATLDALAMSHYPAKQMCIFVVSDGIVQGSGNEKPTPDYIKDMMVHDERFYPEGFNEKKQSVRNATWPKAYSYIAIASGVYKNNNGRVYVGWYECNNDKSKRVPMILVVKVGNDIEKAGNGVDNDTSHNKMPGNRGKRDSQVLLLNFLSKILFDERMTELELDIFHKMWVVTGYHPGNFEALLMVDADTILYPKALPNLVATLENDRRIMGVCGETKILRPWQNLVTMIQVYEYYLSHHLSKAFESFFGNVTCLPGCFSMYRIKCPKKRSNDWVPILTNPDVIEKYSESVVETLHQKNLLLLGEDRYLTTLLLKTFPKRHNVFVPSAVCRTNVPNTVNVLLSQRRRWVNSTIHNLMELLLIRDLCGIFCFSMQFIIAMEFIGSVTLPAATGFTIYLIVNSSLSSSPEILPLTLLAAILGLPVFLMLITVRKAKYVIWFFFYLIALPFWQIVIPIYAFWHFDDFTWGDTRKVQGNSTGGLDHSRSEGYFDHSDICLKKWTEWLAERNSRCMAENDPFSSKLGSSTLLMTTNNFSTSPRGLAMGNNFYKQYSNLFQSCHTQDTSNDTYDEDQYNVRNFFVKYNSQNIYNDALLNKFIKNYSFNNYQKYEN